ncbi:MAG: hypothetical protein A2293_15465 [Elusimicrobia bacterium RIFOXYB2_FULL_49_7]|nr:MAG: hypothetical protein A2293_15465 [Elusimicrobia bacterium RIFOXYB2_FULL_49_7]
MNILLLTGNNIRHRFAAHYLHREIGLSAVVFENKESKPWPNNLNANVIESHFKTMTETEKKYFGNPGALAQTDFIEIERGEINSTRIFDWIQQKMPGLLLVYGTGIIKGGLFDSFRDKMINMHLGLSPYYRGAATNFWPLVNNEPECVGVTIHMLSDVVDGGAIIKQGRPDMSPTDTAHDIGCKTIIRGLEALADTAKKFSSGQVRAHAQSGSGKYYKKSDFSAGAVIRMNENFMNGMLHEYIARQAERTKKYPIIE